MLAADINHGTRGRHKTRLVDAMAFLFRSDDREDLITDFPVGCAASQQELQIVIILAKEAGSQFSVGRQPNSRTVAAEWLSYRCD